MPDLTNSLGGVSNALISEPVGIIRRQTAECKPEKAEKENCIDHQDVFAKPVKGKAAQVLECFPTDSESGAMVCFPAKKRPEGRDEGGPCKPKITDLFPVPHGGCWPKPPVLFPGGDLPLPGGGKLPLPGFPGHRGHKPHGDDLPFPMPYPSWERPPLPGDKLPFPFPPGGCFPHPKLPDVLRTIDPKWLLA